MGCCPPNPCPQQRELLGSVVFLRLGKVRLGFWASVIRWGSCLPFRITQVNSTNTERWLNYWAASKNYKYNHLIKWSYFLPVAQNMRAQQGSTPTHLYFSALGTASDQTQRNEDPLSLFARFWKIEYWWDAAGKLPDHPELHNGLKLRTNMNLTEFPIFPIWASSWTLKSSIA